MNGGTGVSLVEEERCEDVKWNGDVHALSVGVDAGVLLVVCADFRRAEAIIFFPRDLTILVASSYTRRPAARECEDGWKHQLAVFSKD